MSAETKALYKIAFFVPPTHLDVVKEAVFSAGAGTIGDYDHCCWQTEGTGQFRPLPGSQPYLGEQNRIETVVEFRVEMVCAEPFLKAAVLALKQSHPYEEPAYDIWPLMDVQF